MNYFVVEGDESSLAHGVILGQLFQLMIDSSLQRLKASDIGHITTLSWQPLVLTGRVQRAIALSMTAPQLHLTIHLLHNASLMINKKNKGKGNPYAIRA